MMKNNELRIGNIISKRGTVINVKPETILKISRYPLPYKPIQITVEWLLLLGFEKTYHSNVRTRFDLIDNAKIGYDFNNYGEIDGMIGFRYVGNYFGHIQYVHQIQNLYFALTGEELEVKP
ncbi:hypothetical protein [Pedobacter sp. B4-66]|uniref:hypothetical protein n=1 Tax=Pedobacter sp. B4-66 TaxID=2817280 RepID=UPI001BD96DCA|nr:hypothetical protein [Pedobacter sp. B4-66]